ncbi:type II/IV secretion system ATPase subunit [Metallosphaera hakonensis]|nr:type II/IV secretion system ATPase subunit [Metallosphaera hakonensis]
MEIKTVKVIRPKYQGDVLQTYEVKGVYKDYGVAYPKVKIVKNQDEIFYDIEEPAISQAQIDLLKKAYKALYFTLKPADVDRLVTSYLDYIGRDPITGYFVVRDVLRYDVLTTLLDDGEIEDISYSPTEATSAVYVFHREYGSWIPTNILLGSDEANFLVQKIAFKSGKSITLARPILDAMTPEGYRIALTFGREVSPTGSTISIRKPLNEVWTLSHMVARRRVMPPLIASALWFTLQNRGVILVVGRSGSGKTTLINALLTIAPPSWKIVTVEEIPELRVIYPNWIRLVSRKPTLMTEYSETAEIPLDRLISHTFRIRPDLVSVGEVRSKEEIKEFIHSVAAGHGGITSIHAEDFPSLKARFNYAGVDDSFFSIVSMVVFVNSYNVNGKLVRRVQEVGEIVLRDGEAHYIPLAAYSPVTDSYSVDILRSRRLNTMASLKGMTEVDLKRNLEGKVKFLLESSGLPREEYQKKIRAYYESEGIV